MSITAEFHCSTTEQLAHQGSTRRWSKAKLVALHPTEPMGVIELTIDNPEMALQFQAGRIYSVTIEQLPR